MANESKNAQAAMPEIEIELDKKRKLIFDFNAVCKLEEATGRNALSGETWNSLSAQDVRALLWGALLKDDPGLTIERVGQFINFQNLPKITEAIEKAFRNAAPTSEDEGSLGKK